MSKKSLADWWEEQQAARRKEQAAKDSADDVEAFYARCGSEPAVDASLEIIRKEMAAVYRDMRSGRIDCHDGTRLAYVLDLLRKSHESTANVERLGVLEKAMGIQPDKGPGWLGIPFEDSEL